MLRLKIRIKRKNRSSIISTSEPDISIFSYKKQSANTFSKGMNPTIQID